MFSLLKQLENAAHGEKGGSSPFLSPADTGVCGSYREAREGAPSLLLGKVIYPRSLTTCPRARE